MSGQPSGFVRFPCTFNNLHLLQEPKILSREDKVYANIANDIFNMFLEAAKCSFKGEKKNTIKNYRQQSVPLRDVCLSLLLTGVPINKRGFIPCFDLLFPDLILCISSD